MTRRLLAEEAALWQRVMATVKPLHPAPLPKGEEVRAKRAQERPVGVQTKIVPAPPSRAPHATPPRAGEVLDRLDSHWDRRFQKGAIIPDISIDLHGQGLAGAHARLDRTLDQAIHQKLRVVLLVTGKARAHDRASGSGRGAIAAVVRDWLAASRHASHIAAVRQAHPRHGGDGALYIVLKR
jgi:DNA-nicking Smr family endonuclease